MSFAVPVKKWGRVDELDGLRGLLALWVIISHIFCWSGLVEQNFCSNHATYFWDQFIYGIPPVDTFIILSGFAISFLLHSRPESYFEFLKGRFFRIYPVFFVCLMLGIISSRVIPAIVNLAPWHDTFYFVAAREVFQSEQANMPAQIFAHLTLLNGLIPKQVLPDATGTFLPPSWSITLEWQYYLIAPFLAVMVRSAAKVLLIAVVAALFTLHFGDPWKNNIYAFLPGFAPLFLVGIGSYHFYAWFRERTPKPTDNFALAVAVVIGIAILTTWHSIALVIWALCFGSLFVEGTNVFSRILAGVRRLLLLTPLQSLGKISYPLYLVHWPVIVLLLRLLLHLQPQLTKAMSVGQLTCIGLPLTLLIATLLHRFVELPGMALGKRLSASRKIAPAGESAST
jgi:peptidoglycan/LPS O-acetylase OafA/YrhL